MRDEEALAYWSLDVPFDLLSNLQFHGILCNLMHKSTTRTSAKGLLVTIDKHLFS